MDSDTIFMDNKFLSTWVEVVDASQLKQEIREKFNLPEKGLILKKIHKSNLEITYEVLEGGLAGHLNRNLISSTNIPKFLEVARTKFC